MGRRRKAVLLLHDEIRDEEGWRIVVKVWSVPVSTTSPQRVVGYDNHWPKGHHRHFLGQEEEYAYRDVDRLIADVHADVMRVKRRPS